MSSTDFHFDIAVVGSGIMGMAIAYEAARKGHRVAVFERHPQALGATIRNFGMIWPIGQPGKTFDRAMRSRAVWLELAQKAGFWAETCGSLHLAYHYDEEEVLNEFMAFVPEVGYQCDVIRAEDAVAKSTVANPVGLKAALWSETEVNVDPRQAARALQHYLKETLGVTFFYNTAITNISGNHLTNGNKQWQAAHMYICGGQDFETLYPKVFANSAITKCKLQMMRTGPQKKDWRLGPNLCAGLTLQHYESFAGCPSLTKVKRRIAYRIPEYNQWGIHVLLSQTALGELTIGDSHEYGLNLSPFNKQGVNDLILKYLKVFARIPELEIVESWHGIYAKMTNGATELIARPEPGVTIVNGLGGAGMTLSFGLAQELVPQA